MGRDEVLKHLHGIRRTIGIHKWFAYEADVKVIDAAIALLSASPGERDGAADYEFFVAQGIANSPEPVRELGEYLARVMDEDQFHTAERLLLQIATTNQAIAGESI